LGGINLIKLVVASQTRSYVKKIYFKGLFDFILIEPVREKMGLLGGFGIFPHLKNTNVCLIFIF